MRQRALDSLLLFSLLGLGVMTVASGGLGWYVSGRVLRPVRAITETARRASDQHLGERLALTGAQDELKELADTFDDMLERLDQAFAAQRRFVANASHELRTPLTVMRTAIDVALAKPNRTTQQLEDMAARVRRSIDRAENMIEALLVLAISDQGVTSSELLDLSAVAEDALELAAPGITRLGLSVETDLAPAEATGDQQLIERMVWNLVDNAVRHNEPGGWIRISTGRVPGRRRPAHRQQRGRGAGRRRAHPVRAVPPDQERARRRGRARAVDRPVGQHRARGAAGRAQSARRRPVRSASPSAAASGNPMVSVASSSVSSHRNPTEGARSPNAPPPNAGRAPPPPSPASTSRPAYRPGTPNGPVADPSPRPRRRAPRTPRR